MIDLEVDVAQHVELALAAAVVLVQLLEPDHPPS
jgi:hypothetical protein